MRRLLDSNFVNGLVDSFFLMGVILDVLAGYVSCVISRLISKMGMGACTYLTPSQRRN